MGKLIFGNKKLNKRYRSISFVAPVSTRMLYTHFRYFSTQLKKNKTNKSGCFCVPGKMFSSRSLILYPSSLSLPLISVSHNSFSPLFLPSLGRILFFCLAKELIRLLTQGAGYISSKKYPYRVLYGQKDDCFRLDNVEWFIVMSSNAKKLHLSLYLSFTFRFSTIVSYLTVSHLFLQLQHHRSVFLNKKLLVFNSLFFFIGKGSMFSLFKENPPPSLRSFEISYNRERFSKH